MSKTLSPVSMPEFWGNIVSKSSRTSRKSSRKASKSTKSPRKASKTRSRSKSGSNRSGIQAEMNDILEDYRVPNLRLRKDIWETFPVVLIKIDDKDGVERYAVLWHNKHLKEWQKTAPQSWDEYMEYPHWTEVRLHHALKQHPHLYKVLPPRDPSQLMVIEMVFKKKREV